MTAIRNYAHLALALLVALVLAAVLMVGSMFGSHASHGNAKKDTNWPCSACVVTH